MTEIRSIRLPESYRREIEESVDSEYESGADAIRTAASRFEPFLGKVPLHHFSEYGEKVTFRDSYGVIERFYEKAEEENVPAAEALRNAMGYELGYIEFDFDQMREDLDRLEELDAELDGI